MLGADVGDEQTVVVPQQNQQHQQQTAEQQDNQQGETTGHRGRVGAATVDRERKRRGRRGSKVSPGSVMPSKSPDAIIFDFLFQRTLSLSICTTVLTEGSERLSWPVMSV
ncbi:hypothetical protein FQN60_018308, partial [Etheostoma spectabile]